MLWLETVENEEDINHGMVSLFPHLHNVTQNYANLNNTDQISPDFAKKQLIYDDDNDEHLPIPVYSGIKPSMGPEFILNKYLLLLLLVWPPCLYGMLIVEWWCFITRAESKMTLDFVPIFMVLF